MCSHLLDKRTHLNTMFWRGGGRAASSPGASPHAPAPASAAASSLYVLTSSSSLLLAAEELAYDLQQLGRAGRRRANAPAVGAHPCQGWTVHPHLEATVPVGRAVNPVSGTNWEGTGVEPDEPCAAADARRRAHQMALGRLAG
ncbi:hypothetical protein ACU686_05390 [Yinghuangia aomiensis]